MGAWRCDTCLTNWPNPQFKIRGAKVHVLDRRATGRGWQCPWPARDEDGTPTGESCGGELTWMPRAEPMPEEEARAIRVEIEFARFYREEYLPATLGEIEEAAESIGDVVEQELNGG